MGNKLYVGNLSFNTDEDGLRSHFSEHGEVISATIVTDRDTGRSRGFGFVEMATDEEARRAQQALDGLELDNRQLKVSEAKPKSDNRNSRSSYRY